MKQIVKQAVGFCLLFWSFSVFAQPVITSFSPLAAPVGATVTIAGTNFSTVATDNIVYFGGVKAVVSAATNTQLTVAVPVGASYKPITVTVNGLTAISRASFAVTFNTGATFTAGSFADKVDFPAGSSSAYTDMADFDNDGKPDLVSATRQLTGLPDVISVSRNLSSPGSLVFGSRKDFPSAGTNNGFKIADLDGDGKLDIIGTNSSSQLVIYLNTSTTGNIDFSKTLITVTGSGTRTSPVSDVVIADFNGDKKPDIAAVSAGFDVFILKNTGTAGNISFATTVFSSYGPSRIEASDMDGDGLADLVVVGYVPGTPLSVYRNTSTVSAISFGNRVLLSLTYVHDVYVNDIDADGKPDLALHVDGDNPKVQIFRNTSLPGSISFDPVVDILAGGTLAGVDFGDLDGDGKPDLALTYNGLSDNNVGVFRNNGSPGSISFENRVTYTTLFSPQNVKIADADVDGKPDLVLVMPNPSTISILRNNTYNILASFSPQTGSLNSPVTITGTNLTGVKSVSFGGTPAASFSITSPTSITAVVGSGSSGSVAVVKDDGASSLPGFLFYPKAVITPSGPTTFATGGSVLLTASTPPLPAVTSGYNWYRDGVNVVNNGPATYTATSSGSYTVSYFGNGTSGPVPNTESDAVVIHADLPAITSFTPQTAASGATVTLTGTSYTGATAVSFGGTAAASFTVVSPTNITAVVGAGTSGNVSVTTPVGTGVLAGFTVLPAPVITSFSPQAAPSGGLVTLSGTNFTGTTAVSFGGTPATSFTVTSPTTLIAAVGAGANGNVSVTAPGGTANLGGFLFTPAPVITSFTPQTAAAGNTVTISGANFTGATAVSFGGTAAASFTVVSPTSIAAVVGTGTSGGVSVTSPAGTGSLAGFTFLPAPVITSFSPLSAALGSTVTLTGTGFTGTTVVSFGGTPATSFTIVSPTSITAVVGAGTSGNVSVTAPGGTGMLSGFFFTPAPVVTSFTPQTAASGTTITITGTDLTGVTSVSFGGTAAASFTVGSPTSITAVVGTGSTGNISVTGPGGTSFLSGFTYIGPPILTSFTPQSAGSGATVTITGTNLAGTTAVNFGGTPAASFTVTSPTTITAVVGTGASGNVSLVAPGGIATLGGFLFIPAPVITSFTPQSAGSGTTVTITGTNFTGATAVSFGGTAATSFTVTSPTTITAIVGAGASGNVSVTTPVGTGVLAGFTFLSGSVLSFYPLAAPVGATVTIAGSNFSAVATDNIVYFGGVRAVVSAATISQLTVTVPVGAQYRPITVTVNGLTATSRAFFAVTFNTGTAFTAGSLGSREKFPAIGYRVEMADFDSDGKPDLLSEAASGGISVSRNLSSPGSLAFGSVTNYPNAHDDSNTFSKIVDLDGDGKLDVISINSSSQYNLVAYLNTSTTGNISFLITSITVQASGLSSFVIADFNGDKKPDIAAIGSNNTIYIIKNTCMAGTIQFAQPVVFTNFKPSGIEASDIDGDGLSDLIVCEDYTFSANVYTTPVSVYRNTSTVSTISFGAATTTFLQGKTGSADKSYVSDIDVDGKPDIIILDYTSRAIQILRNVSVPANISFAPTYKLSIEDQHGYGYSGLDFGDLDGDGKPDIIATCPFIDIKIITTYFDVFRNNGSAGSISFENKVSYEIPTSWASTSIADADMDGKPDVIMQTDNFSAFILRNNIYNIISSFSPQVTSVNSQVTITGTNLAGVKSVSFGGTPAVSFSITSPTTIMAVVGDGSSGAVTVVKDDWTSILPGFVLYPRAVITPSGPTTFAERESVKLTASVPPSPLLISGYNWYRNGILVLSKGKDTYTASSSGSYSVAYYKNDVIGQVPNSESAPVEIHADLLSVSSFTPQSASQGSTVTITGTSFTSTTAVSFGGTAAASFTVVPPYTITAVVGAGASGNVSVTASGGTATLSGFMFNPPPAIASFSPQTAAQGATVILTGTNFTGATAVSFGGTAAASFTVVSPTSITAVVGEGASGSVSVTTANGVGSLAGFIFISPPKIISFSPQSAASGAVVTLTGTNFSGTAAVNFGGTPAASFTVVSPTTITAVVGAGSSGTIAIATPGGTTTAAGFTYLGYFLPVNNFKVTTTGESCRSSNNGSISITAVQSLPYTATINGNGLTNVTYPFTESTRINDLSAGTYTVCITIAGRPDYSQCYDLVITEPPNLSLYLAVSKGDNSISLVMDGGSVYKIELNGKNYVTSSAQVTLPLLKGNNVLRVATDKECQGVIEKTIRTGSEILLYPNPFDKVLSINIGTSTAATAGIEVRTLAGKLVYSQQVATGHGVVEADLSNLASGLYMLKLSLDNTESVYKIIKK